MNCIPINRCASLVVLSAAIVGVLGCTGTTEPSVGSRANEAASPVYGKATTTLSVNSVSPAFGHDGDVQKQVTITGSGFAPDAKAAWERNGIADSKISVVTTYVSSTQLLATITIAPDADLGLYDVSVINLTERKKGIGYSLFEVTTANQLAGSEFAYDVNSTGEIAGRAGVSGAFYFSPLTGLDTLGSPGRSYAISEDGRTVAGGTTNNAPNASAYVWVNNGGTWQETILPKNPASCIAFAKAIGSDANGAASMVGGMENDGCYNQNNLNRKPRIWVLTAGTWVKNSLPGITRSDDLLDALTGGGIAVGRAGGKAAVWTPGGSGVWSLAQVGASGSALHGVNSDGTVAVGETNGVAQYWTSSNGVWTGPFNLPGNCTSAVSVDDAGEILANGCPNGNRLTPAIIAAPYAAGSVRLLGGFGSGNSVAAESISPSGRWVSGEATVQGSQVGVYWKLF